MIHDSRLQGEVQGSQPPLSNRGVPNINEGVFASLDWLRYSVNWPNDEVQSGPGLLDVLRRCLHPSPLLYLTGETLPVPKGYDTCLALSHGSVRFHSQQAKQKIGVEFGGRDLSELKAAGLPALKLLQYAVSVGARVTRLDLALDIFGRDADPLDIYRAFLAGELITHVQVVEQMERKRRIDGETSSDGVTVYIGSRHSERFVRIYDKAKERRMDGLKWTRIEFEVAGSLAGTLGGCLSPEGFEAVIQAAIKGFCQAPTVGWYTDAITGPAVQLPVLGRRESDRKRWLLKQVAPALKAELAECEAHDDWELYEVFQSILEVYRNREGKRHE